MKHKTCLNKERRRSPKANQRSKSEERKEWNKKVKNRCRDDYHEWVGRWVQEIERADERGDTREVYRGTKAISGQTCSFASNQPTIDEAGHRIQNASELATVWQNFLEQKFSSTEMESMRAEFEMLPEREDEDGLTRGEFDEAVKRMKKNKATGMDEDEIPAYGKTQKRQTRYSLFSCAKYGAKKLCRLNSQSVFLS